MPVPSARSQHRTGIRRGVAGLAVLVAFQLSFGSIRAQDPEPRTWTLSDAHIDSITGLGFSPDGRTLASSSETSGATGPDHVTSMAPWLHERWA